MLAFASLLFAPLSQAQMAGWSHLRRIDVTENSGADVHNYQLLVTFDSQTLIGNGEMNMDGSDIRFTSECTGGTNFNYWIESGINTPTTKVWVKVDTLLSNQTRSIYMHYGNAGASVSSSVVGTFEGPHSSTDSVASGGAGGAANSQRGFRFATTEDILFYAAGKREPNGTTRYVTLFDYVSQAIVYQGQVSGPAAQYTYNTVANPFWLTQGTQYVIELYQGASDGYYFGGSSQAGQHIIYGDMRYCNSCTENTFPTNVLTNYHYGYPDFWYFTKKTVTPAPTYALASMEPVTNLPTLVNACPGDTIQLDLTVSNGVGPYSYSWNGEGINSSVSEDIAALPVSDSVAYIVSITDACAQVKLDTVTFMAYALPQIIIATSDSLICNGETAILTASGAFAYTWDNLTTDDSLIVSPAVSTTYSVIGTSITGCSDTVSFTQQVNVPLTGTQNVTICENDVFVYNAHTYSQAGTYLDTIAGVTACDSIVTTVLTVNSLPASSQSVTICDGETFVIGNNTYSASGTYQDTLSGAICDSVVTTNLTVLSPINTSVQLNGITLSAAAGATSYQWFDCATNQPINGATASTFQPTMNGDYGVIISNGNCEDTSTCVSVTTIGLNELDAAEVISIYPNPNTGKFTVVIQFDGMATITDGSGKKVSEFELKAGQAQEVQLTNVERGIYFLSAGNKTTKLSITK